VRHCQLAFAATWMLWSRALPERASSSCIPTFSTRRVVSRANEQRSVLWPDREFPTSWRPGGSCCSFPHSSNKSRHAHSRSNVREPRLNTTQSLCQNHRLVSSQLATERPHAHAELARSTKSSDCPDRFSLASTARTQVWPCRTTRATNTAQNLNTLHLALTTHYPAYSAMLRRMLPRPPASYVTYSGATSDLRSQL
jgi:hypothetical protein